MKNKLFNIFQKPSPQKIMSKSKKPFELDLGDIPLECGDETITIDISIDGEREEKLEVKTAIFNHYGCQHNNIKTISRQAHESIKILSQILNGEQDVKVPENCLENLTTMAAQLESQKLQDMLINLARGKKRTFYVLKGFVNSFSFDDKKPGFLLLKNLTETCEHDINLIRQKVDKLKVELEEANTQNQEVNREIGDIEKLRQEAQMKLEELKAKTTIQPQLSESQLQEEIDTLKSKLNNLQREIEIKDQKISELSKSHEDHKHELEKLNDEKNKMEQDFEENRQEYIERISQLEMLVDSNSKRIDMEKEKSAHLRDDLQATVYYNIEALFFVSQRLRKIREILGLPQPDPSSSSDDEGGNDDDDHKDDNNDDNDDKDDKDKFDLHKLDDMIDKKDKFAFIDQIIGEVYSKYPLDDFEHYGKLIHKIEDEGTGFTEIVDTYGDEWLFETMLIIYQPCRFQIIDLMILLQYGIQYTEGFGNCMEEKGIFNIISKDYKHCLDKDIQHKKLIDNMPDDQFKPYFNNVDIRYNMEEMNKE